MNFRSESNKCWSVYAFSTFFYLRLMNVGFSAVIKVEEEDIIVCDLCPKECYGEAQLRFLDQEMLLIPVSSV